MYNILEIDYGVLFVVGSKQATLLVETASKQENFE